MSWARLRSIVTPMNENVTPETQRRSRSTWLMGLVLAVAAVLLAVSVAILGGDQGDAEYAPGSPEAAFQDYVRAWDSGDIDGAWAALSDEAHDRVDEREYRDAARWRDEETARIWIDRVTGSGDRVTLHVTIETGYGPGLLGPDRYLDQTRVALVREDDQWRIATPLIGYYHW